jgi:hypothetical protein
MSELFLLKLTLGFSVFVAVIADRLSPWTKLTKVYKWKDPDDSALSWKNICGDPTSTRQHKARTDLIADRDGCYFIERYRVPFIFWGRKVFIPWAELSSAVLAWPYFKLEPKSCAECCFVLHEKDLNAVKVAVEREFQIIL